MLDRIALILLIIGGINWAASVCFSSTSWHGPSAARMPAVSRVIYTIVALSAVWCISLLFRDREDMVEHSDTNR